MYKIYKKVLIWFVVLYSTCISAQVNEYLDAENTRISQSQKTELEVRKFVSDNFDILFSKVKQTQLYVENFKIECNERYKEMYKKDMPDNVFNDIIKGFQFIYILGVKTIPKE